MISYLFGLDSVSSRGHCRCAVGAIETDWGKKRERDRERERDERKKRKDNERG